VSHASASVVLRVQISVPATTFSFTPLFERVISVGALFPQLESCPPSFIVQLFGAEVRVL